MVNKLLSLNQTSFIKLQYISYYIFYLKEIGITFFKIFADYQYLVFKDYFFPEKNPEKNIHKIEKLERIIFDGKTHYDISSIIMHKFNMPEIFYDLDYDYELSVLIKLVNNTNIQLSNNTIIYSINNEVINVLKNLNVTLPFKNQQDFNNELELYIRENYNQFTGNERQKNVINLFQFYFENFLLGKNLFNNKNLENDITNYYKYTHYSLLKNFISYVEANDGNINIESKI